MTPMEITRKRKERLEKERANYVAGIEQLRKEKKAEYLIKLREKRVEKKGAIEGELRRIPMVSGG